MCINMISVSTTNYNDYKREFSENNSKTFYALLFKLNSIKPSFEALILRYDRSNVFYIIVPILSAKK